MDQDDQKRCRHWWIYYGRRVVKGKICAEYKCDICGEIGYVPLPSDKGHGNGTRHGKHTKELNA